ncbi:MAG: molybdopterin molybdotransferase [Alphaproteobacteria bacterium]|jgi:molybdopterin molybdotransferase
MPIEQAIQLIMASIKPLSEITTCTLNEALDRVITQDIVSPINVPAYDNSAMDGYALNYADYLVSNTLVQVGKSFAGNSFEGELKEGECVRIMTGAEIPKGANTVVMQENTAANENHITFHEAKQGDAIRPAGDDIKQGTIVLKAGSRISPIDIGLLASLGFATVPVYRRLKVAVFSTGDELLVAGSPPQNNRIFDSNRPMLVAMLSRLGAEVLDLGNIADNKEKIKMAFEHANQNADCVVTSGGVSVGEADYTREVLDEYGTIEFWKLAIKPGKPLAFGKLSNSIFFGLPGNPVSAAVTFDQIAAPALAYLAGCNIAKSELLPAIATTAFKKRPGRTDYQRAHYYISDEGALCVETAGSQSSGVLSCFRQSNCYAVLESERGHALEGETLQILPFTNLIHSSN